MHTLEIGGGKVEQRGAAARFTIPPTSRRAYADAQWDDYTGLRRSRFPHKPPLRLSLRARFSHPAEELGGTAGFGFWNNPFTLSGGGVLAAPKALWFFAASPPNDQYLCEGVPGRGWKAASLNTGSWPPLLVAPLAAPAILLARVPRLGRPLMRLARRMIESSEKIIETDMTGWHDYTLEWQEGAAAFFVDSVEVLRAAAPPPAPLGFVCWIDNQYAVASEDGRLAFGLIADDKERWMEIDSLILDGV